MVETTTDRRSVGKNGYGVLLAKKKRKGSAEFKLHAFVF